MQKRNEKLDEFVKVVNDKYELNLEQYSESEKGVDANVNEFVVAQMPYEVIQILHDFAQTEGMLLMIFPYTRNRILLHFS